MEFVNKMKKDGKLIMGIGHRVKSVSTPTHTHLKSLQACYIANGSVSHSFSQLVWFIDWSIFRSIILTCGCRSSKTLWNSIFLPLSCWTMLWRWRRSPPQRYKCLFWILFTPYFKSSNVYMNTFCFKSFRFDESKHIMLIWTVNKKIRLTCAVTWALLHK